MTCTRLIPVLLLQHGHLVRAEKFTTYQIIGNPVHEAERFNKWSVDELIYLDISRDDSVEVRSDTRVQVAAEPLAILEQVADTCFLPLTYGGRIRTVDDVRQRLLHGADRVVLNTIAFENPAVLQAAANRFGSQAIVVSIDVRGNEVFVDGARRSTRLDPVSWAREVAQLGGGEILLNSIDRDGTGVGYDLDLIHNVASSVDIPVIACGGVGRYEDFVAGFKAGASAVAAANIFHFRELSDRGAKRAMRKAGIEVRP